MLPRRLTCVSFLLALLVIAGGCGPADRLDFRHLQSGVSQTTPFHDGVTQTTPLVTGEVHLPSGEPAANVNVTAYVSDYQVAAVGNGVKQVEARTDASGRFRLIDPPLGMNTIEAQATEHSKAIRMNVPVSVGARLNLDPLTLQPTGAITGRVKAEGMANLLGTTVFIPGTQYMAFTDRHGVYTMKHVPVGTYEVAAMRPTFATTLVNGVTVAPQQTVSAPDFVLRLDAPELESLSQANGGAGAEIVLRGKNFGATKNSVLSVNFGSTQATRFERLSDTEIRVWVPAGALNGPLVVRSNGVASNALDFQVISTLSVTPYYAALYVGDRRKFQVEAKDALGSVIPNPNVSWELGAPVAGLLDETGDFVGSGEGWSEIRAKSGTVSGLAAVAVTSWSFPATSLSISSESSMTLSTVTLRPDGAMVLCDWERNRYLLRHPNGALVPLVGNGKIGDSPDGMLATQAPLNSPSGAVFDAAGHLYFAETYGYRVRVVPAFDTVLFGRSMTAGRLYTVAGTGEQGFNGDGPHALARRLNHPTSVAVDGGGGLIVMDRGNRRLRRITPDGAIETLAGGGAYRLAETEMPPLQLGESLKGSLAKDALGNLIFAAGENTRGERIVMLCRAAGTYFGRSMQAGMLYVVAGTTQSGFNGDGLGLLTTLSQPEDFAFLPNGDLIFLDGGGYLIRKLGADGTVRTLAGQRTPTGVLGAPMMLLPAPATAPEITSHILAVTARGGILIQPQDHLLSLVELLPH
jgi:hypothetical protein